MYRQKEIAKSTIGLEIMVFSHQVRKKDYRLVKIRENCGLHLNVRRNNKASTPSNPSDSNSIIKKFAT